MKYLEGGYGVSFDGFVRIGREKDLKKVGFGFVVLVE